MNIFNGEVGNVLFCTMGTLGIPVIPGMLPESRNLTFRSLGYRAKRMISVVFSTSMNTLSKRSEQPNDVYHIVEGSCSIEVAHVVVVVVAVVAVVVVVVVVIVVVVSLWRNGCCSEV